MPRVGDLKVHNKWSSIEERDAVVDWLVKLLRLKYMTKHRQARSRKTPTLDISTRTTKEVVDFYQGAIADLTDRGLSFSPVRAVPVVSQTLRASKRTLSASDSVPTSRRAKSDFLSVPPRRSSNVGLIHHPASPATAPSGQIRCELDRTTHITSD